MYMYMYKYLPTHLHVSTQKSSHMCVYPLTHYIPTLAIDYKHESCTAVEWEWNGKWNGNGMGMEQEHTWELFDTYYVGQNGTTGLKYGIADFYSVFILFFYSLFIDIFLRL